MSQSSSRMFCGVMACVWPSVKPRSSDDRRAEALRLADEAARVLHVRELVPVEQRMAALDLVDHARAEHLREAAEFLLGCGGWCRWPTPASGRSRPCSASRTECGCRTGCRAATDACSARTGSRSAPSRCPDGARRSASSLNFGYGVRVDVGLRLALELVVQRSSGCDPSRSGRRTSC